jgi:uncharacterized protein YbbK (DUF523 family)
MNIKLCSACLLGVNCRYNGISKPNEKIIALSKKEILIPICPEQLGGQATPRLDAEITGGDGSAVLDKKAKVIESNGNDVSSNFINGAEEVLKIAKLFNIKEAILKQRSPSCGSGKIYDGTFSRKVIEGDGVTTALLKKNGIKVISEED